MSIALTSGGETVLYDTVTGRPFGTVFPTREEAEAFVEFGMPNGLDEYDELGFDVLYNRFIRERDAAEANDEDHEPTT